jgi:hypothetical protein
VFHQPRRVETVDAAELGEVRGERAQIVLRRHQLLEPEQFLSARASDGVAANACGGPGLFNDDNQRCAARERPGRD